MQFEISPPRRRMLGLAAVAAAAGLLLYLFRRPLRQVVGLLLGAMVIAFLVEPLARLFERKLNRSGSAVAALAVVVGMIALLAWLLLPTMLRELLDLAKALPRLIAQGRGWADRAWEWIARQAPGLKPGPVALPDIEGALSGIATGSAAAAVNLADGIGRLSLMVVLAYFFLCDRKRILLRMELMIPRRHRATAVRMGCAIARELRLYFHGQLLIAAAVAALSSAGLALVGVRSALVLGPVIGLMNAIPYFGPFIGGIPAVLIALGDGLHRALLTAAVLIIVQQLDGSLISPRVMGSLTGFSPAAVLIGIFAGARLAGIAGMLFALPFMLVCRTLFRVFVQRHENI